MKSINKLKLVEAIVLALLFSAANIRGLVIRGYFPAEGAWIEVVIELGVLLLASWLLWRSGQLEVYARAWLKNWPLAAFIVIAAASLFWTVDITATLARVLILVLSSMLAAYLAVRYTLNEILNRVAGFFAVMVVFCFVIVIAWGDAGLMNFYPYYGSWRAIFWHRNYLGSTMALGTLLFLICVFLSFPKQKRMAAFYAVFYVLALALVVQSHSATGLILVLVLHAIFAAVVFWLHFRQRIHAVHYWILGGLLLAILAVGYLKLDFLLGLFNRESNFTGRTGLWSYLFAHYINQRPLLGYGFGAFWQQAAFDLQLRDALGWPYPVVIGDNGYMDILVHLGAVGAVVFAAVLILACFRMGSLAFRERTLLAFVPLLVMAYMLITNFTLSYFLETEFFTWIVMIAFWFAATPAGAGSKNQITT